MTTRDATNASTGRRPTRDYGLPVSWASVERRLAAMGYAEARISAVHALGGPGDEETIEKAYGYGEPRLIDFDSARGSHRMVFHTMHADPFDHEHWWDRACEQLLSHATYNDLPRHVPSLDVGALVGDELRSVDGADEFYLLTDFVPGRLYAEDFRRLRDGGEVTDRDRRRVHSLADYLAELHGPAQDDAWGYRRRLRDVFGSGEGIPGMLDAWPTDRPEARDGFLESLERRLVTWRWRLKERTDRARVVHGDLHPWNILFDDDDAFHLLDRSRGRVGEPADDVAALAVNHLFFALEGHGRFEGSLREVWDLFWRRYLEASGDEELPAVIGPFLAWRLLVVAHPLWYPQQASNTRSTLLGMAESVLESERFAWWEPEQHMR